MFDKFRAWLVPFLRLPLQPTPPFGAPNSVRSFRAARNFYKLRLAIWTLGQVATLVGIIFSLGFLAQLKSEAETIREERKASVLAAANSPSDPAIKPTEAAPDPEKARRTNRNPALAFLSDPHNPIGRLIDHQPWWLFPLITGIELVGILVYVVQLPITYALVRLEYESHWYIVTDRSLRIRSGIISVQESTMSFANVQQVTVSQGPVQRLLQIADVRVQSAGGGGNEHDKNEHHSMHTGIFHSVDNATEIRDLVLERLRNFRAAGLGDPDDHRDGSTPSMSSPAPSSAEVRAAAHDLLQAARELRAARLHVGN